MPGKIVAYYKLTKPGIIQGNAIHVVSGALLASAMGVEWDLLAAVLIGTSFVIASACIANNYMDRGIDAKMTRTKKRASVTGLISLRNAMVYMTLLGVIGFATLYAYTNMYVVMIGLLAYLLYVFAYGWAKRHTIHSTIVGAVPGALPALAGYVAIDGALSVAAWLVFLLVFVWQMPHFYAISIFRKDEYKSANLFVLGAVQRFAVVRAHILGYMLAYLGAITLLITYEVVGAPAGLLLLIGAGYWIAVFALTSTDDEKKWARTIFGSSLILTLLLLVASVLNVFVPPFQ